MTNGSPLTAGPFEPTPAAARARLAAVNLDQYARARNFLDGPVTRLSPYVGSRHGQLRRGPHGVAHRWCADAAELRAALALDGRPYEG